jgi:hypothetical protein
MDTRAWKRADRHGHAGRHGNTWAGCTEGHRQTCMRTRHMRTPTGAVGHQCRAEMLPVCGGWQPACPIDQDRQNRTWQALRPEQHRRQAQRPHVAGGARDSRLQLLPDLQQVERRYDKALHRTSHHAWVGGRARSRVGWDTIGQDRAGQSTGRAGQRRRGAGQGRAGVQWD